MSIDITSSVILVVTDTSTIGMSGSLSIRSDMSGLLREKRGRGREKGGRERGE